MINSVTSSIISICASRHIASRLFQGFIMVSVFLFFFLVSGAKPLIEDSYFIDVTNLPEEILVANPGISNAIANDDLGDEGSIQASIDWLAERYEKGTTGQSTIFFPEGRFDLKKTLDVDSPHINFEGAGKDVTCIKSSNSFQIYSEEVTDTGADLASINREAYLFNLDQNANNIMFKDITLSGPEVHGAIFGFKSDDLEVRDVVFDNFFWSSIRLYIVSYASIHDNIFINAGGRANGDSGFAGGSIFATYLESSEIYNNDISWRSERDSAAFGIKGRKFSNIHIHHNTIKTKNFSIELPFENDKYVEIDSNYIAGPVSIPKDSGGTVPEHGYTFHIHHNYFTNSYSFEWPRNGAEIEENVFIFDTKQDIGNLISSFSDSKASGPTLFHSNLIINPGRGVFWSHGILNNFSFYNNEVIVNETLTPRTEGLFGFNPETNFRTIEIRNNIIEVNGVSRALMRNEVSYSAVIENNTLLGISDSDRFENPDTGAPRGILKHLLFQVGVNSEFTVDEANLRAINTTNLSDIEKGTIQSQPIVSDV